MANGTGVITSSLPLQLASAVNFTTAFRAGDPVGSMQQWREVNCKVMTPAGITVEEPPSPSASIVEKDQYLSTVYAPAMSRLFDPQVDAFLRQPPKNIVRALCALNKHPLLRMPYTTPSNSLLATSVVERALGEKIISEPGGAHLLHAASMFDRMVDQQRRLERLTVVPLLSFALLTSAILGGGGMILGDATLKTFGLGEILGSLLAIVSSMPCLSLFMNSFLAADFRNVQARWRSSETGGDSTLEATDARAPT